MAEKITINGVNYTRYYRVTVCGTMPYQTSVKVDAWTIATERPSGRHIEHGFDVEYSYWKTFDELIHDGDRDLLSEAIQQRTKSDDYFHALRDDKTYENLYFRVTSADKYPDSIDGAVLSETRPSDCVRDGYFGELSDSFKTLFEVMEQHPELLPSAIYVHDNFRPEAVGEALPF